VIDQYHTRLDEFFRASLRNIKDEAEFDKAWDEAGKLNYVNQELTRQYSHLSSLEREPSDPAYNERKHLAEKEIKKLTAKKEKLDRFFRGEDSIEPEQTEAQQRQIELIEKVRELMQKRNRPQRVAFRKTGKRGPVKIHMAKAWACYQKHLRHGSVRDHTQKNVTGRMRRAWLATTPQVSG